MFQPWKAAGSEMELYVLHNFNEHNRKKQPLFTKLFWLDIKKYVKIKIGWLYVDINCEDNSRIFITALYGIY